MKDSNYKQAYDSIMKIFDDNWANEDTDIRLGEELAHRQNQELIMNVMLGCFEVLNQYDPCASEIFNSDWLEFAFDKIKGE